MKRKRLQKMNTGSDIVILFSSFLCLCFCLALIGIFNKLWWSPVRLQYLMGLQGIKGPSYRVIHGNNKEMLSIKKEAMAKPMSLSHDIFHKVQPHVHLWTNLYGNDHSLYSLASLILILLQCV